MMHDHEKERKPMYCPLLKEVCTEGWTPSMGELPDKRRPVCAKWVSVFVNFKTEKKVREIFDCNERWIPDLIQETAEEVSQGAAATESARNHIAGQAEGFRSMGLAFRAMARRNGVTLEDVKALEAEDVQARKLLETKHGGT